MTRFHFRRSSAIIAISLILTGCSTTRFKEKADLEAYKLINEKSDLVPGMTSDVSIEPRQAPEFANLPENQKSYEFLGDAADAEIGLHILSLDAALDLAVKHSRDYQRQKEQLYIQALRLSIERHQFAPIFSGNISTQYDVDSVDGSTQTSGSIGNGFGVNKLMVGGGRLAVNLTSDFFKILSGGHDESAASVLVGTFTQPLLNGRGRKVAMESLTQAERNLLYNLRDFTRFRKEFAVQTTASYYNVLRNKDSARNNYLGYTSFQQSLKRERAFLEEGLKTPGQVARLEQSNLSAESRWTRSINTYQESLDRFKIQLGIPTDIPIVLDDSELMKLSESEPLLPGLMLKEAVDVALVTRLDLYTEMDQIIDAERKILVAANGLQPNVDLFISSRTDSKDGNRAAALDFQDHNYTARLDIELPFDRKADRNNYRTSLINLEVARRSADASIDNVKLDVRNAWRSLEQANRDYKINQLSVDINQKRVEEEELKAELGQGSILDGVDAQNDLTSAQTALTASLVGQRIALLEFWRDVGVLYVDESGQWEKRDNE
jgi:outer membrane protein TolC